MNLEYIFLYAHVNCMHKYVKMVKSCVTLHLQNLAKKLFKKQDLTFSCIGYMPTKLLDISTKKLHNFSWAQFSCFFRGMNKNCQWIELKWLSKYIYIFSKDRYENFILQCLSCPWIFFKRLFSMITLIRRCPNKEHFTIDRSVISILEKWLKNCPSQTKKRQKSYKNGFNVSSKKSEQQDNILPKK